MRNFTDVEIGQGVDNMQAVFDFFGDIPELMDPIWLERSCLTRPYLRHDEMAVEWATPVKVTWLTRTDQIAFWDEASKREWAGVMTRLLVRWQMKYLAAETLGESIGIWRAIRTVLGSPSATVLSFDDLRCVIVDDLIEFVKYAHELMADYVKESDQS